MSEKIAVDIDLKFQISKCCFFSELFYISWIYIFMHLHFSLILPSCEILFQSASTKICFHFICFLTFNAFFFNLFQNDHGFFFHAFSKLFFLRTPLLKLKAPYLSWIILDLVRKINLSKIDVKLHILPEGNITFN